MAALLLVRPEAQSRRLLAALAARGILPRAVLSPVVGIEPRAVVLPEGADLVLTSQNAVASVPAGRGGRAWCVGDRTAAAARARGLDAVSAGGDAAALAALVLAARPERVVHLRGAHAAGDLVARLRAAGVPAEAIVAYDQPALPLNAEAAALLAAAGAVVLPLYSPRSAALVAAHPGPWRAEVRTVAISRAAAAAFARPSRMTLAEAPTGAAMEVAVASALAAGA